MNMGTAMKITQAMSKMGDAVSTLSQVCHDDLPSAEVTMIINQIVKCQEELQKLFERLLAQDGEKDNGDEELRKMIEENKLI